MVIKLEKFESKDIAQLISWIPSEAFLYQFAGPNYNFPLTEDQLIADMNKAETTGEMRFFKAIDEDSHQTVGHIQLLRIDFINKTAYIGRVLVGEHLARGQGVGTMMILNALNYGFNDIGLDKILLRVFDFNVPAVKCYKNIGFKIIDTVETDIKNNGKRAKCYVMEIDKNDFVKTQA